MSEHKKPASKISIYPVAAAIWRNSNAKGTFYSVTFERSYKDEGGKWQTTGAFTSNDLLLLAKVADQAHTEIQKLRSNEQRPEPFEDIPA